MDAQTNSNSLIETVDIPAHLVALYFTGAGERTELPLVIVPPQRSALNPFMHLPAQTDAYVLMQRFGKHIPDGMDYSPYHGIKFLAPWYRCAYLVNMSATTYKAPISRVPTSDNIKVSLELHVNFTITNPRVFVYELGVLRFNKYIKAVVDEGVRMLVRSTPHDKLLDLRGQFGDSLLDSLNSKLKLFGVNFSNVTIPNVSLPPKLFKMLHNIQEYSSKGEETTKQHQFQLKKMIDSANYQLEAQNNRDRIKMQGLEADFYESQIEHKSALASCKERADVTLRKIQKRTDRAVNNAHAAFEKASISTSESYDTRVSLARAGCDSRRVESEQQSKVIVLDGEAEFTESMNQIKSQLAEAEAEAKASAAFIKKRLHELELSRLTVLTRLARDGKMVLRGAGGESIIREIAEADIFDLERANKRT